MIGVEDEPWFCKFGLIMLETLKKREINQVGYYELDLLMHLFLVLELMNQYHQIKVNLMNFGPDFFQDSLFIWQKNYAKNHPKSVLQKF
jgi:hypothetical protein